LGILLWFQRKSIKELKAARRELQLEENRVFSFLHTLGEASSQGVLSNDLHRMIVEGSVAILEAAGGVLYFVDCEEKMLVPSFLTEDAPSFVTLPAVISKPLSAPNQESSASMRSFLRLHTIQRGEGLLGEAWDWPGPKFLKREELPLELVSQGLNAAMISPLRHGNRTVGVLALGSASQNSFSIGRLELFRSIIEQVTFALHHQIIYHQAGEKKMMDRDIDIAREIQRLLLPAEAPALSGYEISGINIPACALSGDYFDYLKIDDNHLGIVIADVSGKGVPASLIMTMARSVLRAQAAGESSPCEVLRLVNRQLYPDMKEDMFISMAYVTIDRISNTAQLARAGHDAPLFYRAKDATVEKLNPKGMAVGIDSGEVFDRFCIDFSFHFESGDCLLLYTDGVTEALNADGREFGIERLMSCLKKNAVYSAVDLLKKLTEELQHFVLHQPQYDDITLIAIRKL
jgi:sigma-B regulation protein RsbU (phosphoserine phosphatase)